MRTVKWLLCIGVSALAIGAAPTEAPPVTGSTAAAAPMAAVVCAVTAEGTCHANAVCECGCRATTEDESCWGGFEVCTYCASCKN